MSQDLDPFYFEKNADAYLERGKAAYVNGDLDVLQFEALQEKLAACKGDPSQLLRCWEAAEQEIARAKVAAVRER